MKAKDIQGLSLSKGDLIEFILLLRCCYVCYHEGKELLDSMTELFIDLYPGEQIRNPRFAGRKIVYDEDKQKKILELRKEGLTIKEISKRTSTSVGYVVKLIENNRHKTK